jgi:hypothetical protein
MMHWHFISRTLRGATSFGLVLEYLEGLLWISCWLALLHGIYVSQPFLGWSHCIVLEEMVILFFEHYSITDSRSEVEMRCEIRGVEEEATKRHVRATVSYCPFTT